MFKLLSLQGFLNTIINVLDVKRNDKILELLLFHQRSFLFKFKCFSFIYYKSLSLKHSKPLFFWKIICTPLSPHLTTKLPHRQFLSHFFGLAGTQIFCEQADRQVYDLNLYGWLQIWINVCTKLQVFFSNTNSGLSLNTLSET